MEMAKWVSNCLGQNLVACKSVLYLLLIYISSRGLPLLCFQKKICLGMKERVGWHGTSIIDATGRVFQCLYSL